MESTAFSIMISWATRILLENNNRKKVSEIVKFIDFIAIDFENIILKFKLL
jgi:hypothetical protein